MTKYSKVLQCLLLICIAGSISCKAQQLSLSAAKVIGRYDIRTNGDIELISSAAYLQYYAQGSSSIKVYVPTGYPPGYIQYSVNNGAATRMRVMAGQSATLQIEAPPNSRSLITIAKTTEAKTGPVFISSISGDAIDFKVPAKPYAIEFIGNSITCGAAADESLLTCNEGTYHDHHNAYDAYGPRVARALHMEYVLSSVSGIGIYRNWNSNGPTMPEVYKNLALDTADKRLRNFSSFAPQIVCIALGTNDFSMGDGKTPRLPFDSAVYVSHYIAFVQEMMNIYPNATLALLSSPMVQGNNRKLFERCLQSVSAAVGNKLHLFYFNEMKPTGCGGHPSVAEQGLMAAELQPFIAKLLDGLKN